MKENIVKLLLVVIVLFSIPLKVHGQLPEWEGYQRTFTPGYETETYKKDKENYLNYYVGTEYEEGWKQILDKRENMYGNRLWDGWNWRDIYFQEIPELVKVSYDVTYNYEEAYKMIDMVNEERRNAGVSDIKTNDYLMQLAMERAAETALYWCHKRPDGSRIDTKHLLIEGENIVTISSSASDAMSSWKNSPGHYVNMIDSRYKYAGFGVANGYCVQIFCSRTEYYDVGVTKNSNGERDESKKVCIDKMPFEKSQVNYTEAFTTWVDTSKIKLTCYAISEEGYSDCQKKEKNGSLEGASPAWSAEGWYWGSSGGFLDEGEEYDLLIATRDIPEDPEKYEDDFGGWGFVTLKAGYTLENLTPDICTIDNGKIKCIGSGTAKIKASVGSISKIFEIPVRASKKAADKGTKLKSNGATYIVTSKENKTVSLISSKIADEQWYLHVAGTIEVDGIEYKVTKINSSVFKNCKSLKIVSIGDNITTIGKNAFYGCTKLNKLFIGEDVTTICNNAFKNCKKLRNISISSNKIKAVGKNALKGIHKKATIKVPKKKYKTYKKIFGKKTGYKKTMKIKK